MQGIQCCNVLPDRRLLLFDFRPERVIAAQEGVHHSPVLLQIDQQSLDQTVDTNTFQAERKTLPPTAPGGEKNNSGDGNDQQRKKHPFKTVHKNLLCL